MQQLHERGAQSGISLFKLSMYKRKWDQKNQSSGSLQLKYALMDQTLKEKLDKISRWMQETGVTN